MRDIKKINYLFLIILLVFTFSGVESMAFFWKKPQYREYTIRSYLGAMSILPVQIAIAKVLEEQPELLQTEVKNIVPLHLMIDPRGEYYKKDAKLGPAVYVKTINNMPVNYLTATQVFNNGDYEHSKEFREKCEAENIECRIYDAHEYVKSQPLILNAVRDALKYPCKYLKEENIPIWSAYADRMREMAGGDEMVWNSYKYIYNRWPGSEPISQQISHDLSINLRSHIANPYCFTGKLKGKLIHVLQFINNDKKVVGSETYRTWEYQ